VLKTVLHSNKLYKHTMLFLFWQTY